MNASQFDSREELNDFDFWGEHPEFSLEDWKHEVANDDTRLGYWDWVISEQEKASDESEEAEEAEGVV